MGLLEENYDYLEIGCQHLYGKTFSEFEDEVHELGIEITEADRRAIYRCGKREVEFGLWEDDH